MLSFRLPQPEDRAWILPLLQAESIPLCEYSFPVLFCWQSYYQGELTRLDDRLLVRLTSSEGSAYLWPVGQGDPMPALHALLEDAAARQEPLRLISLFKRHTQLLETLFPGKFVFSEIRDSFDYLYDINRLADLPGKKLHAKRNHINRLDEDLPGWEFVPLTQADIPACLDLNEAWFRESAARETSPTLEPEYLASSLALKHFAALGLDGGILRHKETLLGFTLGAPLTPKVYDVHFERAKGEIPGTYPAVNREFARLVRTRYPEVRYLNREDDMGEPGLRQAKLSYHPELLEVKYCAVFRA